MAHYIIHTNKLAGAGVTITPDSELAGAPVEYVIDGKLFTHWRPAAGIASRYWRAVFDFGSATACDFVALAAFDFVAAVDVIVEHSPDNSAWTTAATIPQTLGASRCIAEAFTSASRRYWRLTIDAGSGNTISADSYLGVLYLGDRLELPRISPPFSPPGLSQGYDFLANVSEDGLFIGGSIFYAPFDMQLNLKNYTPAWVRANVPPFMESLRENPFFIQWDSTNRPEQVAYCWTVKEPAAPRYSSIKFMEWTLRARGILTWTENEIF